jgi:hypothetical protein
MVKPSCAGEAREASLMARAFSEIDRQGSTTLDRRDAVSPHAKIDLNTGHSI